MISVDLPNPNITYDPVTGQATLQPGTYAVTYGVSIVSALLAPDVIPIFRATINEDSPILASILSVSKNVPATTQLFEDGTISFLFTVPDGPAVTFEIENASTGPAGGTVTLGTLAPEAVRAYLTIEEVPT